MAARGGRVTLTEDAIDDDGNLIGDVLKNLPASTPSQSLGGPAKFKLPVGTFVDTRTDSDKFAKLEQHGTQRRPKKLKSEIVVRRGDNWDLKFVLVKGPTEGTKVIRRFDAQNPPLFEKLQVPVGIPCVSRVKDLKISSGVDYMNKSEHVCPRWLESNLQRFVYKLTSIQQHTVMFMLQQLGDYEFVFDLVTAQHAAENPEPKLPQKKEQQKKGNGEIATGGGADDA